MTREIKFTVGYGDNKISIMTMDPKDMKRGTGIYKQAGYVMRRVLGHPNANKRGYVSEHRLIMEEYLGRLLKADEIIHHINQVRDDNRTDNLLLLADQKRHATAHAASAERDSESQRWIPDPALEGKKFRLLNKNTGLMEIRNLSQLINTTFRKGRFELRGVFTGLKDKNGKEIYEGDIVNSLFNDESDEIKFGDWEYDSGVEDDYRGIGFYWGDGYPFGVDINGTTDNYEIIGNIYENPELLKRRCDESKKKATDSG